MALFIRCLSNFVQFTQIFLFKLYLHVRLLIWANVILFFVSTKKGDIFTGATFYLGIMDNKFIFFLS